MRELIQIATSKCLQLQDITPQINRIVANSGITQGSCIVFCPHTTAGLVINENADPDVRSDLERAFEKVVPSLRFDHSEGNSPGHFLSCLANPSLYLLIENARLKLGRWQGIYFCEFDGPRRREVWLQIQD